MNDSTATYIVHTTVNSKEAAADLVREAILSGHPHTTITARPAGLSERRLHSDELGEILDLVAQARERAGAPPFVLELTPGQRALVLQALRPRRADQRAGRMTPAARKLLAPDDLLGPGEVCDLLEISRATLMRYRDRGFPSPWRELEQGPVWLRAEVLAWPRPRAGRPPGSSRALQLRCTEVQRRED